MTTAQPVLPPRPRREVIEGFQKLLTEYGPSALVTDAQSRNGALRHGLAPVVREHRIAGPALTVGLELDCLVDCMPVLAHAQPGDVMVIACHGAMETAMWGAMMTTISQAVGIAGAIVDGAIRDNDEIRDLDFPVWSRGSVPRPSPTAVHGRTDPIRVNVPVIVGEQPIHPGDIVVADEVGVCVVPAGDAEAVLERATAQADKEVAIRARISDGATVHDLLREFGHL